MERKHRKRMMLPHLNCLYKKEAETQDKSLPKPKISDLMIGINTLTQTSKKIMLQDNFILLTDTNRMTNL